MNKTVFDLSVIEDLKAWAREEPKPVKKVFELNADIHKNPYVCLGKPEGLKHPYKGYWFRRINNEHRLIYQVLPDKNIAVISVYGHYDS